MSSIMVPWHMHVINGAIHKVRTQGKRRGRSFVKIRTRGEGGQIFDLFKCTYFIDAPNSCKYYPYNFCGMCRFNGSNILILQNWLNDWPVQNIDLLTSTWGSL